MHLLKYVPQELVNIGSITAKEGPEYVIRVEVLPIEACVGAAPSESLLRPESIIARPALGIAQTSVSLAQLLEGLGRRWRSVPIWMQLQGDLIFMTRAIHLPSCTQP